MAISLRHQNKPFVNHSLESMPPLIKRNGFFQGFSSQVKRSEILFFTSQLSLLLEIETPLNLALKALRDQTENRTLKEVIGAMLKDIEEGRQLSDAMKKHPKFFGNVFTSMVRAGESGGFLKDILDRILEMQEKRQALIAQLKSALTYPAVLFIVSFLVIIFVITGVLPKFTSFFMGKEEILPLTTRFLMGMSVVLRTYWWIFLLSATGMAVSLKFYWQSKKGRELLDWLIINFPLIANISNKIYTSQFLRTLGYLMESRVPLLESLEVTRGTVNNLYFQVLIDRIVSHVKDGGKFSKPFSEYPNALESAKQMVATGEETGKLPKVMLRLAEFYDNETERDLKAFSSMVEPIALIVMGVVVGLIVSSVILPLFRLAHVVN